MTIRERICWLLCGEVPQRQPLPEEVRKASHDLTNAAAAVEAGARQLAKRADVLASLAEAMRGPSRGH